MRVAASEVGLVLPEPDQVVIAEFQTAVIPRVRVIREELREHGDVPAAHEMCRRLEAYRKYLGGKLPQKVRDDLAAETRETEILIGELLGPPAPWGGDRSKTARGLDPHQGVPQQRHTEFWIMAQRQKWCRGWMWPEDDTDKRFVSRKALLEKIQRKEEAEKPQIIPEVRAGDFRDVLAALPNESTSLILTDPPYGDLALDNYTYLSEFAARVLRPGGSLICYTGQSILPDVLDRLSEHLRYWWTFALDHRNGGQQLPGKWVLVEWKPVVWFVKGHRSGSEYIGDRLRGSKTEKSHHEWAQGIEEVTYIIEKLTEPDEVVVDPFAGSGSFGRAALEMGRRFTGADLSPESAKGTVLRT